MLLSLPQRLRQQAPLLFVLLLIVITTTTTLAQQQESNHDEKAIPILDELDGHFPLDGEGRLDTYALLVDAQKPACLERLGAAVEGPARAKVFGNYDHHNNNNKNDDSCLAACLDVGTAQHLIGAVLPHKVYDSAHGHGLKQWFTEACAKVEVCFMSYHQNKNVPLEVYWKDPSSGGSLKHHLTLKYGEKNTRCFHSYLGHQFVAHDAETDRPVPNAVSGEAWFTVDYTAVHYWGINPPHPTRDNSFRSVEQQVTSTLQHEWQRHNRIQRTFSSLGFHKGRLPNDVFATLGAFYYNNARRQHRPRNGHAALDDPQPNHPNMPREEWNSKGVFVNWWETDVFLLQIPWDLRTKVQGRLLHLVEQWAGVPVEQTVLYGLRQYTTGARLLTHVDRHVTHAVSLIVNIAQGNLTQPWPVEVHDHADRLHEVMMEPGDIVYYESAKCLHGRNRPLRGNGAYFVNLFTHYAPVNDKEWFLKPNPPGTPEPLLSINGHNMNNDVEEECYLKQEGLTRTASGGLGVVQGVSCPDHPELGPYLSPTLFQAENADDLLHWWRLSAGEDYNTLLPEEEEDDGGIEEQDDEESPKSADEL